MKKIFVSFVLSMLVFGSCTVQNTINEKSLIGTWINLSNKVKLIFSADFYSHVDDDLKLKTLTTSGEIEIDTRSYSKYNCQFKDL
jgi:hypothetical protein